MNHVNTVRGAVEPAALGTTLMHEHVFVRSLEATLNYSTTWESDDTRVDEAVRMLDRLADAGIDTVVDLTVLGLGRDIRLVERVAAATRMSIIAATGAYVLDRLPYQLAFNPPKGGLIDGLAAFFIADLTQGIAGTMVKAGIIKCATDVAGFTPDVTAVIEAAAIAQVATGVPISTHADAGTQRGLEQQQRLMDRGVDPARIIVGHCGDTLDLGYLRAVMDAGSTVGLDRFGMEQPVSTAQRIAVVEELCALGYADRIVLSHDAACHSEWMDPIRTAEENPDWSMFLVPEVVIPTLRERGVPEDLLDMMTVSNPRRLLTSPTATQQGDSL
ncbi:hypothetical protein ASD65_08570 [Microbacterium sp. Root61]|uniref:phosphotriesterase family protein n=1 Tax=Microbacterium sp. Root61 TaxID=1736570 RepID=UPI0006FAB3AE|nr:hypothetical protein [Microbacterium sp. Root61]KRA24469.1 hypothetical protein ASD65_08570 [Microbacterium sp. Root61]